MSLKVIKEPNIALLCMKAKDEDRCMKHSTVEGYFGNHRNSFVVGKLVKVNSYSPEARRFILTIKEFLPTNKYGKKFKAVVNQSPATELAAHSPQIGDRFVFYEPIIFKDPQYKDPRNSLNPVTTLLLQTNHLRKGTALMFAKKHDIGVKPGEDKPMKLITQVTQREMEKIRQQPISHVTQNPQSATKNLNPNYDYKTISDITSSDMSKPLEQKVNIFGVVHEIIKPISITKNNKFMLVCKLVDDSNEHGGMIKFYFFVPEDTVIKEIEQGDIVRLHRVKLEIFKGEIDGRTFFSQDIVLFKKGGPAYRTVSTAKNTLITDKEKKRVEILRKWYDADYTITPPTLLSKITQSGLHSIFCKVMPHEPRKEGNVVKVAISDGSTVDNLVPALPLEQHKDKKEGRQHLVTEITVFNKLEEYARLKVNEYVLFRNVESVPLGSGKFQLLMKSETSPIISSGQRIEIGNLILQIEEIELRLLECLEEANKNNKNNLDGKCRDTLKIIENNQSILPSSSNQEMSIQTRQLRNKKKIPPAETQEKFVPHCNKSDQKAKDSARKKTYGSDTKNTESDPGSKSRKQLFTPNYTTDLSDAATDLTSEHNLEMTIRPANEVPAEDAVNLANTSFNDIVEKVKTKFCMPKRPNQQSLSNNDEDILRLSSSKKTQEGDNLPQFKSHSVNRLNNRKRAMNSVPEPHEDIEDAETVVNISCQSVGNKRKRLESLSTEEGNINNDVDDEQDLGREAHKVSSWLFHPKNNIIGSSQDHSANEEFDVEIVKKILCCNQEGPDLSKYVSATCYRISAFLMETIPSPSGTSSANPLDLVSGYCRSGCEQMFVYSSIKWHLDDDNSIPLCPDCAKTDQELELELMLMFELIIMDTKGCHSSVLAVRNHAEQFLNCTVQEFIRDDVVRQSRVRLLTDYTLMATYCTKFSSPMLDITVAPLFKHTNTYALVDSHLKLPRL